MSTERFWADDEFRDAHEAAMQDHILDKKPGQGWPHVRLDPPLSRDGLTKEIDGCDDLCSDDIVDRLAARLAAPSLKEGSA